MYWVAASLMLNEWVVSPIESELINHYKKSTYACFVFPKPNARNLSIKTKPTNSGESDKAWCLLANLGKNAGLAILCDIMRHFEGSKCSTTFSMNNTFRDSLTIKVSHCVKEERILEQGWATFSNSHCCGDCFDWASERCCGSIRILVKNITGNIR